LGGERVQARSFFDRALIADPGNVDALVGSARVAMEACSSAHHWGRALIELGREV
jgi:hypothetical protein